MIRHGIDRKITARKIVLHAIGKGDLYGVSVIGILAVKAISRDLQGHTVV